MCCNHQTGDARRSHSALSLSITFCLRWQHLPASKEMAPVPSPQSFWEAKAKGTFSLLVPTEPRDHNCSPFFSPLSSVHLSDLLTLLARHAAGPVHCGRLISTEDYGLWAPINWDHCFSAWGTLEGVVTGELSKKKKKKKKNSLDVKEIGCCTNNASLVCVCANVRVILLTAGFYPIHLWYYNVC